jgi:hypothetical protein
MILEMYLIQTIVTVLKQHDESISLETPWSKMYKRKGKPGKRNQLRLFA